MPKYAHTLTCACHECRLTESGCPICGNRDIEGKYAATSPYGWFWEIAVSSYRPVNVQYCPACGAKLPDRGHHPDAPTQE